VTLSESQRREVLSKVMQTIDRQFMGAEPDTARLRQEHESAIVESADSRSVRGRNDRHAEGARHEPCRVLP
jgi:hypothetical protein